VELIPTELTSKPLRKVKALGALTLEAKKGMNATISLPEKQAESVEVSIW